MIVRCTSFQNAARNFRYSLTIGKTYPVLAVEFYDKAKSVFSQTLGAFCLYRIRDDEGIIVPLPANLFEVISAEIPDTWVLYTATDGSYSILPSTWAHRFFWDDFYNDEPTAKEAVRKVIQEMDGAEG